MEVYNDFPLLKENTAIALGYFDGVHLGHRAVIGAAVDYAKVRGLAPAVFTFLLDNDLVASRGGDILSASQKEKRIGAMGVQHYVCPSASAFYGKSAAWFVEEVLYKKLKAKAVFCGKDFTLGKAKEADVTSLKKLCKAFDIEVIVVDSIEVDGETVSSTRIRNLLKNGEVEQVNALLGAPYAIDFEVVQGKQLGRTIGTPTINQLYPPHLVSPKYGVYITSALVHGKNYAGATGFGTRPTVNGDYASAETFLKDFKGDLYGEHIETSFYKYLYPQVKFDSLEDLAAMIHRTADEAALYLKEI